MNELIVKKRRLNFEILYLLRLGCSYALDDTEPCTDEPAASNGNNAPPCYSIRARAPELRLLLLLLLLGLGLG